MEEELITVIVPIYNVGEYLDECITSIIKQKYKKLEILLIDDGSTDSSAEISDKYSKKDKKDIIYSKCHLVGIIVSIFVTKIPLAMRIFMSFRYIEFLSVPNLLEKIKMKQTYKKFILIGIMISYFVYFIYGVYIKNGNTVLPYNTIFFN